MIKMSLSEYLTLQRRTASVDRDERLKATREINELMKTDPEAWERLNREMSAEYKKQKRAGRV